MSRILAILDRVIVRPVEVEKVTTGGIIVPKSADEDAGETAKTGIVVSCGPDVKGEVMLGWRVMYPARVARPFEVAGEKLEALPVGQLLCALLEDENTEARAPKP